MKSRADLFALSVLFFVTCMPLPALAADSDGDGVDDSIDAFPTKPEATTDTDGDGMPDSIDVNYLTPLTAFGPGPGWSSPDGWFGAATSVTSSNMFPMSKSFGISIHVPPSGGSISFNVQSSQFSAETTLLGLTGGTTRYWGAINKTYSYNLAGGVHGLTWGVGARCLYPCTVYSHQFSNLSATNVYVAGSLTEDANDDGDGLSDVQEATAGTNPLVPDTDGDGVKDGIDRFPLDPTETVDNDNDGIGNNADLDDDNDGLPDAADPAPLNRNSKWPLDGAYKGSAIKEGVSH